MGPVIIITLLVLLGEAAGHRPRSGAAPRRLRYARPPATAARKDRPALQKSHTGTL